MTTDEQIERLESRLNRLEVQWLEEVRIIRGKLEGLSVEGARQACPSPGACITLSETLKGALSRIESLEGRILTIEKWQSKIMGIGTILVISVTLFGPYIRKLLKLE